MDRVPLGVRKGAWTEEEDCFLKKCIEKHGEGKWHQVPYKAGLNRCRKSCRLRWLNYLSPHIKRGNFTVDEVDLIIRLHKLLGNRWSLIAGRLPGRTSNDVKNYWKTYLKNKSMDQSGEVQKSKTIPNTTEKTTIIRPQPRTFSKNRLGKTEVKSKGKRKRKDSFAANISSPLSQFAENGKRRVDVLEKQFHGSLPGYSGVSGSASIEEMGLGALAAGMAQCQALLNTMEDLDEDSYNKVLEKLHDDVLWRQIFMDMPEQRRLAWIKRL